MPGVLEAPPVAVPGRGQLAPSAATPSITYRPGRAVRDEPSSRIAEYLLSSVTYFPLLLVPCILGLDGAQRFEWIRSHRMFASLALGFWGLWSFIVVLNPLWLYAGDDDLLADSFPPRLWAAIGNIAVCMGMLIWLAQRSSR